MAKLNEIAYMIYDQLGIKSDDSRITIDHILFSIGKYRSYILKQQYTNAKKTIPNSNYQTICIDTKFEYDCISPSGGYLVSLEEVPELVNIGDLRDMSISPSGDEFGGINFTLISRERFRYVGHNKWLSKIIYYTIGSDNKLYATGANRNYRYIKRVNLTALFDDPMAAYKLSCNNKDTDPNGCNYLEMEYPFEDALVPILIESVVKELTPALYRPEDTLNNASDELTKANG